MRDNPPNLQVMDSGQAAGTSLKSLLKTYQQRVEQALLAWLPDPHIIPTRLHEAMRYATLNGGKRVRPVLTYLAGQVVGVPASRLDGPACAVELTHVYSLIHDDLPAMDNDVLRRGKPTCHIQFDEATAILAGDALQTLAYHILAHDPAMVDNAAQRLQMVEVLAQASGSRGMAGGQAIDLAAVGKSMNLAELEDMHIHKTGALIRASVKLGLLSQPNIAPAVFENLDHYAKCIGLAFQIRDDILDVEGDTEVIGKTRGADIALNKPTYPSLLGMSEAKRLARDLCDEAIRSLDGLDEKAQPLRELAEYIIARDS